MQPNNPYGNPPPYGPPPGGFGRPPQGGFGGPPNPYGPPGGFSSGGGGPSADVLQKLSLPAIFMMVAMGIGIAFQLLSLVLNLLGTGMGAMSGGGDMGGMMSGIVGMVFNALSLFTGGFVIFAMTKMKNAESWGMSLAGVVLGMLPCIGPCCWLGIPVGIWAIVVLVNDQVKSQFKS